MNKLDKSLLSTKSVGIRLASFCKMMTAHHENCEQPNEKRTLALWQMLRVNRSFC